MVFGKYWMKNMKVSSKESEEDQQIGLGILHSRIKLKHLYPIVTF